MEETQKTPGDSGGMSRDDSKNPLRMGYHTVMELEEITKAFRSMNQTGLKKRYILTAETVHNPESSRVLIEKGKEIDLSKIRILRRYFKAHDIIKTVQPDEGIMIVSDMNTQEGIEISSSIVSHLLSLGKGRYERFIDRVDSFSEFLQLLKKEIFPRLLIIGYLPADRLEMDRLNYSRVRRFDSHIRVLEVTYSPYKTNPAFPGIKQIHIQSRQEQEWDSFIQSVVREYTKPYYVEDF